MCPVNLFLPGWQPGFKGNGRVIVSSSGAEDKAVCWRDMHRGGYHPHVVPGVNPADRAAFTDQMVQMGRDSVNKYPAGQWEPFGYLQSYMIQ